MFKTAVSLEETGKTQIVALDKTGTITSGEPKVTDMLPADGVSEEELLTYAYALEQKSEHPLARAVIVKAGEYSSLQKFDADGFQAVPGNGLSGKVNGSVVCGGNLKFIRQSAGISEETEETARKLAEEGKTPLFLQQRR